MLLLRFRQRSVTPVVQVPGNQEDAISAYRGGVARLGRDAAHGSPGGALRVQ